MTTSPHLSRRRLLGGGASLAVAAALLPSAPATAGATAPPRPHPDRPLPVRLPAPTGPHQVGTTTLHLVDRSRHDPYLTTQPYRELMVNITYPATDTGGYPVGRWLTPGWAASTDEVMQNMTGGLSPRLVDWAGTPAHAYVDAPVSRVAGGRPVLLYTVGHWGSYSMNRASIEDLASRGYVVVSFDPTYETPVVFPGGRMVGVHQAASPPDAPVTSARFLQYIRAIYGGRMDDAQFVLDGLSALNAGRNPDAARRPLPRGLPGSLDLSRTGAFSGGAGAGLISLQLMHEDRRVDAVAIGDTDVSWPTDNGPAPIMPVVERGSNRPVFAINPASAYADPDPLWDQMWNRLRGWRLEVELRGGGPIWLSDFQSILPQVRRGLGLPEDTYVDYLGTVDPAKAVAAQRAYLAAFFDLHLCRRDNHLLDGPSPGPPRHPLRTVAPSRSQTASRPHMPKRRSPPTISAV